MLEPSGLYYPNRIARTFFLAMEDVLGKHGLGTALEIADLEKYSVQYPPDTLDRQFDFAAIAAMNSALETMYGMRGGRGMALRVGRAAFSKGIKYFGVMKAMRDTAFQSLPRETRVDLGLQALASLFTHFSDQASSVEQDANSLIFRVEISPMAWGRTTTQPVCHAMVGLIQECLRWSSNGQVFYVRETACRASGADACLFRVNKAAIGGGL